MLCSVRSLAPHFQRAVYARLDIKQATPPWIYSLVRMNVRSGVGLHNRVGLSPCNMLKCKSVTVTGFSDPPDSSGHTEQQCPAGLVRHPVARVQGGPAAGGGRDGRVRSRQPVGASARAVDPCACHNLRRVTASVSRYLSTSMRFIGTGADQSRQHLGVSQCSCQRVLCLLQVRRVWSAALVGFCIPFGVAFAGAPREALPSPEPSGRRYLRNARSMLAINLVYPAVWVWSYNS